MAIPSATCVECGGNGRLVKGDQVHPDRPDAANELYYLCACGAYCGAHPGTCRPLGRPANRDTRKARIRAHKVFDRLWKGGLMGREAAYAWLADRVGVARFNCHIGLFDRSTADRVTRIVTIYWNSLDAETREAAETRIANAAAPRRKKVKPARKAALAARRRDALSRLSSAGDRASRHW
jgi:hypothetical protein